MFSDSSFGSGYSGNKVWEASLLVCLVVWTDYARAEDAKSSAGAGAWDALRRMKSKATTMTLYWAKLGTFLLGLVFDCTRIWRSHGYNGGVHASGAAITMTRGIPYPEDVGMLDLAGAVMAIRDSISCETDVISRTEFNQVLISLYYG
ncbi:hypothetical protein MFIFM68171_02829 [Madurella fahalii]|uniref:Uncharacterized protein n=1 Tax=Madurella fahalii TaxID=1157608 RepID=A0ABQ0G4D5_9PEZI